MNINEKNVSEYNIDEYINERNNKSFSEIFLDLKKDVINKVNGEKYPSIDANYTPIFLYHVMGKGIDLKELSMVLQLTENYEDGLNRFFELSDVNFDEKESIWENMEYFFYKKENDKIIVDENKLKYIEEFCKNVREKKLLKFHSSRIDIFLSNYMYGNEEYIDRFSEIVKENPILQKSEHFNYKRLDMRVLENLADCSYDVNLGRVYDKIKKNEFIYKSVKQGLITLNYSKKYTSNLSFIQMAANSDEDFLEIFYNRFSEVKQNLKEKDILDFVNDSKYSMTHMVKDKNVILDINKFKVDEDFKNNIPLLFFIQGAIKNNKTKNIINMNSDFIDGLKRKFNEIKVKNDITYEEKDLIEQLDLNNVLSCLEYYDLNKSLDTKEKTTHKMKI